MGDNSVFGTLCLHKQCVIYDGNRIQLVVCMQTIRQNREETLYWNIHDVLSGMKSSLDKSLWNDLQSLFGERLVPSLKDYDAWMII